MACELWKGKFLGKYQNRKLPGNPLNSSENHTNVTEPTQSFPVNPSNMLDRNSIVYQPAESLSGNLCSDDLFMFNHLKPRSRHPVQDLQDGRSPEKYILRGISDEETESYFQAFDVLNNKNKPRSRHPFQFLRDSRIIEEYIPRKKIDDHNDSSSHDIHMIALPSRIDSFDLERPPSHPPTPIPLADTRTENESSSIPQLDIGCASIECFEISPSERCPNDYTSSDLMHFPSDTDPGPESDIEHYSSFDEHSIHTDESLPDPLLNPKSSVANDPCDTSSCTHKMTCTLTTMQRTHEPWIRESNDELTGPAYTPLIDVYMSNLLRPPDPMLGHIGLTPALLMTMAI